MSANLIHSVFTGDSRTPLRMRQHAGDLGSINFDDLAMFGLHVSLENNMV